jgi:hypothetical protein
MPVRAKDGPPKMSEYQNCAPLDRVTDPAAETCLQGAHPAGLFLDRLATRIRFESRANRIRRLALDQLWPKSAPERDGTSEKVTRCFTAT